MNLQTEIERVFGCNTFARPLFYSYPGGLRFELSESGGVIDQFLTALRKATRICNDIFHGEDELVVCLRAYSDASHFIHRPVLRTLRSAGIPIPSTRSIWRDEIAVDEWYSEDQPEYWINVAFKLPVSRLDTLLWGALAKDLAPIQPQFNCILYLFNLARALWSSPMTTEAWMSLGRMKHYSSSCTVNIKNICWITTAQRWIARLQRVPLPRLLAIQAKDSEWFAHRIRKPLKLEWDPAGAVSMKC